jgi:hypothetical protein
MKYAAEMGSGAMIHITVFINTGSGIQNLRGRGQGDSQTRRQQDDLISILLFL